METVKKIRKTLEQGGYNETLEALYGAQNVPAQILRYESALERYASIYGEGTAVGVFSVPYATCFFGNGAELAGATRLDVVAVTSAGNGVNITRLRTHGYTGEDNTDFYQRGPFREEIGFGAAVLRGMLIAFRRAGVLPEGVDIYFTGDAMPGSGLNEPVTMAAMLAGVYNVLFAGGKFNTLELAQMARWVLTNYCEMPEVTTAQLVAAIAGGVRAVDFTGGSLQRKSCRQLALPLHFSQ
ncbi:hypothetical protein LJB77_00670 [Ruminococcaceae bacterium OttesenSCG-928-N02]|nr:hypothetical protein [Ruminococcaceae bacterium OttesenSCG-928-N02]